MTQAKTAAALLAEIQAEKRRLADNLQKSTEIITDGENESGQPKQRQGETTAPTSLPQQNQGMKSKETITNCESEQHNGSAESQKARLQPAKTLEQTKKSAGQAKKRNQTGKWLPLKMAAIGCCFLLLGAGFFAWQKDQHAQAVQAALDVELQQLRQENDAALAAMATKVSDMTEKVEDVSAALTAAGDDVSTSAADSQQATAAKLEELNQELASLRESLAILQEKQGNS